MKNNKILLLAYTGLNFGDDMFVYTICKHFPNQQFFLQASQTYSITLNSLNNLTLFHKSRAIRIFEKIMFKVVKDRHIELSIKNYAAVVYVIGGLFDENDIWRGMVKQYGLKKLKKMMWQYSFDRKIPFFLLGSNVTRVKSNEYIEQMDYLFEGLYDICFRDLYSYNYFKHLSNVRYAPDIVFNCECNVGKKDGSIIISVWGPLTCTDKFPQWKWASSLWDDYLNFLLEIIRKFNEMGKRVTLLALCENEGDLDACNVIINEKNISADVVTYDGDLEKIIGLFEKASFVIGTRFHSIIMALNAQCSFYPIVYESKTQQLLNDIGYLGKFSHIEKKESYIVDDVINNYLNNVTVSVESIKKEAREQFRILKELLEG